MDWTTLAASTVSGMVGGGLLGGVVSLLAHRHQARRENRQDTWWSYDKQIAMAEKAEDRDQVIRLATEYAAQLEAWRAQQGVEALAPRSISADRPTTLTEKEVQRLKGLLAESQVLNPAALVAESHWLRGNAYYESGDFRQAVDSYAVALQLRPDYPEAYYNRAVAYAALSGYQKAMSYYTDALPLGEIPLSTVTTVWPTETTTVGMWPTGTWDSTQKAIADYTEALRLWPDLPEAYYNRGGAYGHLGDYQKAIADYTEALRLRPDYPEAYYNRACLYSLQQDIEACIENLERAIGLVEKYKEMGRTAPDLEWARQDSRVKKLLGLE